MPAPSIRRLTLDGGVVVGLGGDLSLVSPYVRAPLSEDPLRPGLPFSR